MGILGAPGNDVDDAVDRIRPPNGASGATNDFNALNILEHHVLHFPKSAREESRVDGPAIDEHEHIAGQVASEAANADGPSVAIDAGDFDSRGETKGLRNRRRAGAL